jgi:putative transposase
MRGYNCHEKIEVYRTTNRLRLEAGGDRHTGRRSLPQNGHFGGDLVQLEAEVSGLGTAELRRLRQLEDENSRLKQVVADLTLDKQMLQDVLKQKF